MRVITASQESKRPSISAVVAVHNEEKYLPFCLAALKLCGIDEAVFVLDRCLDKSKLIIEDAELPFRKRIIEISQKKWSSPTAEPFALGFKEAGGDVVYSIGSDIYVDPAMFLVDWSKLDICSFRCQDYAVYGSFNDKLLAAIRQFVLTTYEKVKTRLVGLKYFTGVYGYRKSIKLQHIDYDAEDQFFLSNSIRQGYRYKYFHHSRTLHLRPRNVRSLKYRAQIGVSTYHVGLLKAMFFTVKYVSVVYLREYLTLRQTTVKIRKKS